MVTWRAGASISMGTAFGRAGRCGLAWLLKSDARAAIPQFEIRFLHCKALFVTR